MKIPIILVGYNGSQCIVPVSKYLTDKYLKGFDIIYLNYTDIIAAWGEFLDNYLSHKNDKYIIFALDDYLIADYIDMVKYESALSEIGGDVVCVKLCQSTPEEHEEYPITTQYCIWDKEYLSNMLYQCKTPWQFEIFGSKIFKYYKDKKILHRPCLDYFTNSSISSRWEGIRLDGLNETDTKYIKENLL